MGVVAGTARASVSVAASTGCVFRGLGVCAVRPLFGVHGAGAWALGGGRSWELTSLRDISLDPEALTLQMEPKQFRRAAVCAAMHKAVVRHKA